MQVSPVWRIDLSAPPQVIILGTAVHGERTLTEQHHSNFWVMLLFHYHGEIAVDGHVLPIAPGHVGVFPPSATITIRLRGRSMHRYAHLALQAGRAGRDQPIAAMQDLGADAARFDDLYQQAIRAHATAPERARMLLWDILWQLSERTPCLADTPTARHPALEKALALIEIRLAEPLRIAALADEVGISSRQLGNLFQAALGLGPAAYVRSRRLERARLLLTQTRAPIARIAADVGIPDLQAFNKAVRRALGSGPRAVRRSDGP